MPYYFGSTIEGWARTCFEDPIAEEELKESDIVYFVHDIVDWMEKKYGEEGDCECERNPKSNRETYEIFPPKSTDQTKIGKWLRNYMDFADLKEDDIEATIYRTIHDNISIDTIEKLFHSLDLEDQLEFRDYISSDDRFSNISESGAETEPLFSEDSENEDSENEDSELSDIDYLSDISCASYATDLLDDDDDYFQPTEIQV